MPSFSVLDSVPFTGGISACRGRSIAAPDVDRRRCPPSASRSRKGRTAAFRSDRSGRVLSLSQGVLINDSGLPGQAVIGQDPGFDIISAIVRHTFRVFFVGEPVEDDLRRRWRLPAGGTRIAVVGKDGRIIEIVAANDGYPVVGQGEDQQEPGQKMSDAERKRAIFQCQGPDAGKDDSEQVTGGKKTRGAPKRRFMT